MPRKLISSTQRIEGLVSPLPKVLIEQVVAETPYDKGMFSDVDSASIPSGGLKLATNSVIRFGMTSQRPGTSIFTPTAPDTNRVLFLNDYVRGNGVTNIIRHTALDVYYLTTSAWVHCTTGSALVGTDFDHFSSVVINDRYFFTNNGKNKIQELDLGSNTYNNLGNADKYKKITGFFNRIVAANLQGASPNPVQLAWSGDLNFGVWDSVTDPSAGVLNIVDSSVDISDFITDIFGFDAVLVVLRQKSIWLATKQPSASDPFNLFCKIPGLGCTCTYGAAKFPMGIVFPDLRTKSVYVFTIDGDVEDIGSPIRNGLFAVINDPEAVFSSYNPTQAEYSICVPNELTGVTKEWRYSFRSKAWTYNEYDQTTTVADVDNIAGSRSINELQGTIDSLLGTIDDLATPISQLPRRIYGRLDGDIVVETDGSLLDYVASDNISFPPEVPIFWQSKQYDELGGRVYITTTEFKVKCTGVGQIILDYYRDGVQYFNATVFPIDSTMLNRTITLTHKKQIKCNRFQWILRSASTGCSLVSSAIRFTPIPN